MRRAQERLRLAVEVVSDFLVPLRFGLERDAAEIVAQAGNLAPYRNKDNEHITTSLLLFALVEFGGRENDRELETVVEPFLTTLRRWDGYTQTRESYFTTNIKTIRPERDLPTVSRLSTNVGRLLKEACEIAKIMRFNALSSGTLAGAFLRAESGVFLNRLGQMNFDREPFRHELEQVLDSRRRNLAKKDNLRDTSGTHHVFIVHGHDEAVRESVARFIENLGLKVIILLEMPDQGLTIIEKFERKPYPSVSGATKCGSRESRFMVRTNHEHNPTPEDR